MKRKQDKMSEDDHGEDTQAEETYEEVVREEVPDEPPVEEKDLQVIVDEVLRGEWGVGQDRRMRLAVAGHDPNAVQREIVNRANGR